MKKFSLLESFKYSDEEIEDFFLEFIDQKKFTLKSGFLTKDNRFFTDVAGVNKTTRKCKMATIRIEGVGNGIQGPVGGGRALTSFESLDKVLTEIKKFYARSGESPNFIIEPSYDDIDITFFMIGGIVDDSDSKTQDQIIELQKELVPILKSRGYKRVTHKSNNWVEIRTPVKGGFWNRADFALRDVLTKARAGQLPVNDRNQPLIDWAAKVAQAGFTYTAGGGDNQVVVQLKKA
jgi:hypothetical protein